MDQEAEQLEEQATLIAVASRDGKTVSGHIGKCAEWIVYSADDDVHECARISLSKDMVFHHYKDQAAHPLQSCVAVVGASAGDSFVEKMKRRGMEVVLTAQSDPLSAVREYMANAVIPPKPRPIGSLVCKIRDALS